MENNTTLHAVNWWEGLQRQPPCPLGTVQVGTSKTKLHWQLVVKIVGAETGVRDEVQFFEVFMPPP